MAKRKTKRNSGRSQARHGFKICKSPTVHVADTPLCEAHDRIDVPSVDRLPVLFAIARDPRTIFTSWNIDWRSAFEKATPSDRQVHLRVIGGDGITESIVVVEPMGEMHYLTISGLHASYRVEIGYFQPLDVWHSVATSADIKVQSQGSVDVADVDLATIPFHLSFQQLSNQFAATDDVSIAKVVSEFQKRMLNGEKPNEATPRETQFLRDLNLSRSDIAAAERNFRNIDTGRLARRPHSTFRCAATSPPRGFQASLSS
jgi:hypothetical protein